jgi:hypothetical protein
MSKLSFAAAIRAEKRTTNASKNLLHRLQAVRSVFMKTPRQSNPGLQPTARRRVVVGHAADRLHDGAIVFSLRLGVP